MQERITPSIEFDGLPCSSSEELKASNESLKKANQALGFEQYEHGTIIVGGPRQGKSTILNLLMGTQLISVKDNDIAEFKIH